MLQHLAGFSRGKARQMGWNSYISDIDEHLDLCISGSMPSCEFLNLFLTGVWGYLRSDLGN